MPWEHGAPQAGFTTGQPWLPMPASHRRRAVDLQEADPQLGAQHHAARFLTWRRERQPALRTGSKRFLDAPRADCWRSSARMPATALLCLFNLGAAPASLAAPGAGRAAAPIPASPARARRDGPSAAALRLRLRASPT